MFVKSILRAFFRLLYHSFAFTYDFVAAAVSFGRWQDWLQTVLPFIEGTPVLELGHGPGHLQRTLLEQGLVAFALDESAQMGTLAKGRLGRAAKLVRGLAQALPFPHDSFRTIVSTFPTEYIFEQQTLSEIRRCLDAGGRLVALPLALPHTPLLRWLYRVTGESPAALNEAVGARLREPFERAGFDTAVELVELNSSTLLIVTAQKR